MVEKARSANPENDLQLLFQLMHIHRNMWLLKNMYLSRFKAKYIFGMWQKSIKFYMFFFVYNRQWNIYCKNKQCYSRYYCATITLDNGTADFTMKNGIAKILNATEKTILFSLFLLLIHRLAFYVLKLYTE